VSGRVRVLLVTGSTRGGSVNTAALTTMAAAAPSEVTAVLYDGLAGLPAFNPDHDGDRLPETAAGLRRQIAAANAVLFCTPEYAGSLPGSFKNLLDWTVGGGEMYGKIPVDRATVGPDGTVRDPRFEAGIAQVWDALLGYLGQR
jgi:chromate reductase, NAD(P)H dehydrogenase (quinone)